jgi:hypothetical protein
MITSNTGVYATAHINSLNGFVTRIREIRLVQPQQRVCFSLRNKKRER